MRFTLKKQTDFENVYENGAKFDLAGLIFYWLPNQLGVMRYGYSISKKAIGKACKRNKVKRWFRNINCDLSKRLFKTLQLQHSGPGEREVSALNEADFVLLKEKDLASYGLSGMDVIVRARPDALKAGYKKNYLRFAEFYKRVFKLNLMD